MHQSGYPPMTHKLCRLPRMRTAMILALVMSCLIPVFPLWSAGTAKKVPGPVVNTRLTDEYVRLVGRDAYFWAWPLVNVYDRRLIFKDVKKPMLAEGGIVPQAPINHNCMLTDYIAAKERAVACPNQDVVYGVSALALEQSPVVVQVPDFGKRFWVYQIVDLRTDSFVKLGKMYGTRPGFYLLVGPTWKGKVPAGIKKVFRSSTNTGYAIPRVFREDTAEDLKAVQGLLNQIMFYPLAEYDGKMKSTDWSKVPIAPTTPLDLQAGNEEIHWVVPEYFFDVLPLALNDAPPLPGEEARYAQVRAVLAAAAKDRHIKDILIQAAREAEKELIQPLRNFRNFGEPRPHNWSTISNGAMFGTDYYTRTAVAKSNIFVNAPQETVYFYLDLDEQGVRLNGSGRYTITFVKGQLPPVNGFWSLTLYNEFHFFAQNEINRYSMGTKSKQLKFNADGSLTLYVQADPPAGDKRSNWLPAPKADFSLYIRAYWPQEAIRNGTWTPPAVIKVKD